MFTAHQYLVLYSEKLLLVCVILVPGFTLLLVANVIHGPLVLPYHVAVSVSVGSWSLAIMYSCGVNSTFVAVFAGLAPVCVGTWLVVKL